MIEVDYKPAPGDEAGNIARKVLDRLQIVHTTATDAIEVDPDDIRNVTQYRDIARQLEDAIKILSTIDEFTGTD